MFADRAKIIIRSGKGGDGHVSFRRELYVPNGGPDGGDGGRGGDVIFEVDEGQNTLGEYRHKHKFKAQDGQEGGKKRCHGADGDDIVLHVKVKSRKTCVIGSRKRTESHELGAARDVDNGVGRLKFKGKFKNLAAYLTVVVDLLYRHAMDLRGRRSGMHGILKLISRLLHRF